MHRKVLGMICAAVIGLVAVLSVAPAQTIALYRSLRSARRKSTDSTNADWLRLTH